MNTVPFPRSAPPAFCARASTRPARKRRPGALLCLGLSAWLGLLAGVSVVHAQTAASPAAAAPGAAAVTAPQADYAPQRGQAGKDVIWIATPDGPVARMLRLAQLTPGDVLLDLGSGDGKIVLAAASEGARAHGVEYHPDLVALSQRLARQAGLHERASFEKADLFTIDLAQASVVTMYLLPELNLRLRHRLMALKPGTRVVSHEFRMGRWLPDETSHMGTSTIHLWIIPANMGGRWRLDLGADGTVELEARQSFQQFQGMARLDKLSTTLRETQLRGAAVRFAYTDARGQLRQFQGTLQGDRLEGHVHTAGGASQPFSGQRLGAAPAIDGAEPVPPQEMEYLSGQ